VTGIVVTTDDNTGGIEVGIAAAPELAQGVVVVLVTVTVVVIPPPT
jgi:hypothetical protein